MSFRRITKFLIIGVLIFCLRPVSATADPPQIPSSFYGTVKINGVNVQPGTTITAIVNNTEFTKEIEAELYNGDSVYAIIVPGDDPETGGDPDGGTKDAVVTFKIGNTIAEQTGTWISGAIENIDLTAIMESGTIETYLPLIIR